MRKLLTAIAVAGFGVLAGSAIAQDYPWKPDRPNTLIVPWAAGGSTDQMARIVATELESELKQKVVVVNQPGASGSVGTKGVLEGAKDGYTWAAGAAVGSTRSTIQSPPFAGQAPAGTETAATPFEASTVVPAVRRVFFST